MKIQRVFISPVGFTHTFIVDLLIKYKISPGDKLVLITKLEEGTSATSMKIQETINKIREYLLSFRLFPERVMEIHHIDIKNFWQCLISVFKILEKYTELGEEIFVNLSSGMRILNILLLLSALIMPKTINIFIETEDGSKSFEITNKELKSLLDAKQILSSTHIQVLKAIMSGKRRIREIADHTKLSAGTVSKYVSELEKFVFVERTPSGVQLSSLGEAILHILSIT